jgi:hypothetical protein
LTKSTIQASPSDIRKFGYLFAVVGVLIAAYMLYRGHGGWPWALVGSGLFLTTGLFLKPVLKPVYIVWMKFAHVLGWINTRLLLGVFFYLVMTPLGLFLRLLGKDLLDQKIDRSARSYWVKRERVKLDPARYEQLF